MSEEFSHAGRLLGLDVGARRIGMAVSDPLGITAQGLPTLHRKNKKADFAELEKVIRGYDVVRIVVGLPLHMRTGGETAGSVRMQEFAEELRNRFQLPVDLWDERLTTAEAQRLLRENEIGTKRRAQVVDQMAAVLILHSFMEFRRILPA